MLGSSNRRARQRKGGGTPQHVQRLEIQPDRRLVAGARRHLRKVCAEAGVEAPPVVRVWTGGHGPEIGTIPGEYAYIVVPDGSGITASGLLLPGEQHPLFAEYIPAAGTFEHWGKKG